MSLVRSSNGWSKKNLRCHQAPYTYHETRLGWYKRAETVGTKPVSPSTSTCQLGWPVTRGDLNLFNCITCLDDYCCWNTVPHRCNKKKAMRWWWYNVALLVQIGRPALWRRLRDYGGKMESRKNRLNVDVSLSGGWKIEKLRQAIIDRDGGIPTLFLIYGSLNSCDPSRMSRKC